MLMQLPPAVAAVPRSQEKLRAQSGSLLRRDMARILLHMGKNSLLTPQEVRIRLPG